MKVKFLSKKYMHDFVEETEDGKLVTHPVYTYDEKEIIADVIEERKYTLKLKLPDGNTIIKKRKQVEAV